MFAYLVLSAMPVFVEPEVKPGWHADWDTVRRIAAKEKKPILAVFA